MKPILPTLTEKKTLKVVSMGAMAVRALVTSEKWQVISRSKRSFYCSDLNGNIICIGRQEIGKGPFTILCSSENTWPEKAISQTRNLWVRENDLFLEGATIIIDLQGASVWKKSLLTITNSQENLIDDLQLLAFYATSNATDESLGSLIPHFFPVQNAGIRNNPAALTVALHKRFLDVISEVQPQPIFLNTRSVNNLFADTLQQLIGLGLGLTPSGDDFLAGIIMGFFRMGKKTEAKYLACYFNKAASDRTTFVSLAFYRALAHGFVTEPYTQLLESIGSGERSQLERILKRIGELGATSGWDTLTGILFGISLVTPIPNISYQIHAEIEC